MNSDKEQRNEGIVPSGNQGLTRYSSDLVERGLNLAKKLNKSEAALKVSSQTTEIAKPRRQNWKRVRTLIPPKPDHGGIYGFYCVAISPDGQTLANSGVNKIIQVWHLETGKELLTVMEDSKEIIPIAFSPDGQFLASGGKDIKLWQLNTGKKLCTLKKSSIGVGVVAFSPDGQTLASGDNGNNIELWQLHTGKRLHTLRGHSSGFLAGVKLTGVRSVRFSPDGLTLASCSYDKTVKVWDVKTGQEIHTLRGHSDRVLSLTLSPDGQLLVSCSADKTIKIWSLFTGELIRTISESSRFVSDSIIEPASGVSSVAISPDSHILVSGNYEGTIKLWNLHTGELLDTLFGSDVVTSVAFSPNGQTLASGIYNSAVEVWQLFS